MELMTFIYLYKSLLVTNGFHFNIQYLFFYLLKLTYVETGGTDNLYLLMQISCSDKWFSF